MEAWSKMVGGAETFKSSGVGEEGMTATLSSMEASVDRRGLLGGGIGGNSPNDTEEETTLEPRLDVLDLMEFCDLWDVYDVCLDVLEVCGRLLAIDEASSSSARILADMLDEGRDKELTVDVRVEAAFDLLGELDDHLAMALVNRFAGRRPLPSGDGDNNDLASGGDTSPCPTELTVVELCL